MATRKKLGNDYGKNVIDGTGPFQFVEWVPGDHVTVKRWDAYPGSMTPFFKNKGKAYLDGIRWRFIQEAASRALAIENGELDALHGPAPQDIDRLKKNGNLKVTQLGEESVWFIGLNFDKLEFGDIRVRQAVSHALDRNAIVEKLVFGYGTTAFGPLPTSDPTYYKAVTKFNQFDKEKSKSLMTAAGWKAGSDGILEKGGKKFSFELAVTNESFSTQLAAVIQAMLKDVGMDVKVNAYDRATHFSKLGAGVDSFTFKYLWPNPYDVYVVLTSSSAIPIPNWAHAKLPDARQGARAVPVGEDARAAPSREPQGSDGRRGAAPVRADLHPVERLGEHEEGPRLPAAAVESLPLLQRRLAGHLARLHRTTATVVRPHETAAPAVARATTASDDRLHPSTPPLHHRRDDGRVDRDLLLTPRRAGRSDQRDPESNGAWRRRGTSCGPGSGSTFRSTSSTSSTWSTCSRVTSGAR